jgi:leader peptidase (prepilin peptidase) / N-methyltransferase
MILLPDWMLSIDDLLFRFVTRGPAWRHVAAFLPLGLLTGVLLARWTTRLVARESYGVRQLPSGAAWGIMLSTAAIFTGLILAVTHARCQWITEGGSINWGHWRLLYHDTLLALLIVATAIDLDQYLIPDEMTVPGVLVGIGVATCLGNMHLIPIWVDWNHLHPIEGPYIPEWIKSHPHWHGLAFSLAGLATGAGVTWLARSISRWVLGTEALGFGDVTLMAMIGSFLGWQPIAVVFLLAPVCGIAIAIGVRLTQGRIVLPYGPFLSAASLVVLLSWRWIWTATRELFGHGPTLAGLGLGIVGGMALLLGLLRLYRAIPVERRTPGPSGEQ